jgi:hypothetical protein
VNAGRAEPCPDVANDGSPPAVLPVAVRAFLEADQVRDEARLVQLQREERDLTKRIGERARLLGREKKAHARSFKARPGAPVTEAERAEQLADLERTSRTH